LGENRPMYLVPGTYYMVFGSEFLFKIYNIKYVFYPNETKVFQQTLSQSSLDRFNEFPKFSGTLRAQKSIDIHEFVLTETTCVAIENSFEIWYQLFDENDELLSFRYNSYYALYSLSAGTYRLKVYYPKDIKGASTLAYNYSLKIAAIPLVEDDNFLTDIPEIYLNQNYSATCNYRHDMDVFKIVLLESEDYNFSATINIPESYIFVLYDENHEFINYYISSSPTALELAAGTYYFMIYGQTVGKVTNFIITTNA
jgi:hypothetical protein